MVPFGAPGWAFVPPALRRRRGAPKYARATHDHPAMSKELKPSDGHPATDVGPPATPHGPEEAQCQPATPSVPTDEKGSPATEKPVLASDSTVSRLFRRVIGRALPENHPDGQFSNCLRRNQRRYAQHVFRRLARRRNRAVFRTKAPLPRVVRAKRASLSLSTPPFGGVDHACDATHTESASVQPSPDVSDECIRMATKIAMRDLPWKPYLHGKEHRHRDAVIRAYEAEMASLLSTVLREVKPGDSE